MHINPHQQARRLRALLQEAGHTLSYTQAQQLVARSLGFSAWQELILHDDTRPTAPTPDTDATASAAPALRLAYVLTVVSEREQERGNSQDMWELLSATEQDRQHLDTIIANLLRSNPEARVYTLLEPRVVVMRDNEWYHRGLDAADAFFAAAGDSVTDSDEDEDEKETCACCEQEVDAEETVLVNDHLYCTNCITDGRVDPDALGTCAECGQPYGADPDGSEGVLVHRDENGDPDYDQDRDHVPVPEDE
ncbi:glyoxalase superfamily protein [Deinococcus soli (ex Cha et al. 2016)]|uniref:Glyoxalase-related protein domain-containing protein n=2 Tax=Deinococcus soli (ex Cha et al. 2016) TaxID=1309411 RepID=A0AAE3XEU4_9DEIO|nr:glyoxalase superfamily protein [Deinococcus soli (ex Cha et al. 2016)]MDR6218815.1 hypothetical protein [Deinococcus soli (ex Cha et al. 2016)]MDR6328612.1 hypothetical protein [Deinococcus soli (ex Cha et al. 2016)]MDR6751901.1 hypothetical protein [Deinococcus soli (ex Cha et al. 2016)]